MRLVLALHCAWTAAFRGRNGILTSFDTSHIRNLPHFRYVFTAGPEALPILSGLLAANDQIFAISRK